MFDKRTKLIMVSLTVIIIFLSGVFAGVSVLSGQDSNSTSTTFTPDHTHHGLEDMPNHSGDESMEDREATGSVQAAVNGTATIYIEREGQMESQGSGFVYKDDYIITNHHVITSEEQQQASSETIYIKYSDESWTEAKVVGSDKYTDIAVLKPERVPDFAKTLHLMDGTPEQSERVYAVGAPLGYSNSVASGIVSATSRSMRTSGNFTIPDTIQTDAEIDPGNSGGPLVLSNNPTKVVGVNRAKQGTAIGFAISSRMTKRVANSIIENGEFNHTYVGIAARSLTPIVDGYEDVSVKKGIVIADTMEGSPAAEKLKPSKEEGDLEDIIIEVEGKSVSDLEDLSRYLTLNKSVGDEVQMTVYNDGETRQVTITLADRDDFTE